MASLSTSPLRALPMTSSAAFAVLSSITGVDGHDGMLVRNAVA
ncbi:hypothetical protein [Rhodococcus sp. ACPA1]|nr:hypothetical protein [Rhodococcus sp. ACPA1]